MGSMINQANARKMILHKSKVFRDGRFTRISKNFMIELEYQVEQLIEKAVRNHPSVGKTLDEFRK